MKTESRVVVICDECSELLTHRISSSGKSVEVRVEPCPECTNKVQRKDGFFQITSIHRNDIKEALKLTDNQVAKITDSMMKEIARRMCDDYCTQLFWAHLPIIIEWVTERNGIKLANRKPRSKKQ